MHNTSHMYTVYYKTCNFCHHDSSPTQIILMNRFENNAREEKKCLSLDEYNPMNFRHQSQAWLLI